MHATKTVYADNPVGVAVQILFASTMRPGPLLDSFLEAGGIAAVVRLLRKSTDGPVLVYTASLITHMVNATRLDGRERGADPGSSLPLADQFNQAGEWETGHMAILCNVVGRFLPFAR
jgi:hypothetical protein